MFGLGAATRIHLAVGATDMRKGFEGLYGLVREVLQLEPRSGLPVFVFQPGKKPVERYCFEMAADYGFAPRQTLHNARKGLLGGSYPYHPYFGQTFEVFGSNGGLRDFLFIRMPNYATGVYLWRNENSELVSETWNRSNPASLSLSTDLTVVARDSIPMR